MGETTDYLRQCLISLVGAETESPQWKMWDCNVKFCTLLQSYSFVTVYGGISYISE